MIKLIKSTFFNEEQTRKQLADFILSEEILSMGKSCKEFEEQFAAKQQTTYSVYVSNGSVANLLLIQSLLNIGYLQKGDKVGFSALTWPTNVMPIIQLGLIPVPIDCELETLNVSSEKLSKRISELKAFFITNVLGFCDNLPEIKKLCDANNVILLEDNCESLGSKVDGKLLGNYGIASTFSFFVGHHMSTIEGGMVCTNDKELYESLVMGRAHGWDRNLSADRQTKLRSEHDIDDFYSKYTFYQIASNFRPTEINGFVGLTQIQYWDEIVNRRAQNFHRFSESLGGNDDFVHYDLDHMDVVSNFAMPVVCKNEELASKYRKIFSESDIEIRPVIAGNMTKQPFYLNLFDSGEDLENSDFVHTNGFYFGNNPELTDEEVGLLCKLLEG